MTLEHEIQKLRKHTQLRYAKVRHATKIPIEKGWPNKHHTYNQILPHIATHINYGVLCGHGHLAVVDTDHPELNEYAISQLPETFTVQTGRGGHHFYYFIPELNKRIVLEHGTTHYGEIQSQGQMVVGPGSKHPNGKWYEITNDHPIHQIPLQELTTTLTDYIKPKPKPQTHHHTPHNNQLPHITEIIDTTYFKQAPNGELYGPNPWHGSTTGKNTWINPDKNVAYCFRHQTGITPIKAIALNQGIIEQCDQNIYHVDWIRILNEHSTSRPQ